VAADLAGERLEAVLASKPDLIKVSHKELLENGRSKSEEAAGLTKAMGAMRDDGAGTLVVSRRVGSRRRDGHRGAPSRGWR
jgi:1-phosphofructokinase